MRRSSAWQCVARCPISTQRQRRSWSGRDISRYAEFGVEPISIRRPANGLKSILTNYHPRPPFRVGLLAAEQFADAPWHIAFAEHQVAQRRFQESHLGPA